jgi:DNA polymerase I
MNSKNKLPGAACEHCPLKESPLVHSSGPLINAKLVVIGEAPGATEVEQDEPFVGPSGKLLDYALHRAGVDRQDVFLTNIVACRPPGNREPDLKEITCCYGRLELELSSNKAPVLALGRVATEALSMGDYNRGVEFDWDGRPAMHTYHPAYLLREPDNASIFLKDVDRLIKGPLEVNPKWTDPTVLHIQSWQELQMVLDQVPDNTWVAFDIETDQLRWYKNYEGKPPDPILMLQMAWTDEFGVVLDDIMLYDTPETVEILSQFFRRVRTVAHNGKFDQVFLQSHLGLGIHLDFDTMLAHAILDENSKHGLKELTTEYFGIPDYEAGLVKKHLLSRNDKYSKVPFDDLAKYGVIDTIMTLQFHKLFEGQLIENGQLEWPFHNIIMRAANAFVDIEIRGIKIDVQHLLRVREIMEEEMEVEARKARESVGLREINLNSPQQVAAVIYDQLRMPAPKSRKLGPRSTNHEAIEPLKGKHPFIDYLMAYRRVAKLKSSYADNILECLDHEGAVHTTFQVAGTEIGRLSARNPALQTIPRAEKEKDNKGLWGALIKSSFIARPGKVLVVVDYSQAELRVAAVLANEPFLFDAYEHDRDLHTEVAIAMYGEDFTKEQRMNTKMFNFSYLYGGNEYSFAMDAGLPIHVAKQFVQDYNKVMPNLTSFRKTQFELLDKQGYVESPFGRRRHFEIITRANMDDARKACVHAPIAGTASDLTLLSGCQLEEEGYNVLLLVHDSVILEVPEEHGDEVAEYAVRVMEGIASQHLPQVKWKADPEVRQRWSDAPKSFETILYS